MSIDGWRTQSLGSIADVIDPHPSHRAPVELKEGIPFPGIGDFSEDGSIKLGSCRFVSDNIFDEHQFRYQITEGDIGFGRVASIGKVVRLRTDLLPYVVSPTLAIIKPNKIDSNYLVEFLKSIELEKQISSLLTGTTRSSLGIELLRKLTISFPELPEQIAIGKVLSTIDLAITQTEAIIAKQQRIKTGLMQDLLTKGIDENGNIRSEATHEFKDSSIGRIPVEWEVKKISEAGDVKLGRQTAPRYKLGINSRPYLRVINISEDRLDLSDMNSMDFTPDEFKKYALQPGDVLLTEGDLVSSMNVGRSAVFRGEIKEGCCFQNSLIRFRPPEDKTAEYFHFAFCYLRAMGYFANATMATTVFHLSAGRLKKLYVPVPKTTEQVHISKILAQQDKNIDTELSKREKLLLLKTGLMQDLLTGKVRVTPLLEKEPASR
jgi:type I restriction enzyme, S subunit